MLCNGQCNKTWALKKVKLVRGSSKPDEGHYCALCLLMMLILMKALLLLGLLRTKVRKLARVSALLEHTTCSHPSVKLEAWHPILWVSRAATLYENMTKGNSEIPTEYLCCSILFGAGTQWKSYVHHGKVLEPVIQWQLWNSACYWIAGFGVHSVRERFHLKQRQGHRRPN